MFDPSYLLALTGGLLGPKLGGAVGLFLGLLHLSASLSDQRVCPRGRFTVRRLRVRPSLRERKEKENYKKKKKKNGEKDVARDRTRDEKSKRGKWGGRRGGEQVWLCASKRYRVSLSSYLLLGLGEGVLSDLGVGLRRLHLRLRRHRGHRGRGLRGLVRGPLRIALAHEHQGEDRNNNQQQPHSFLTSSKEEVV